MWDAVGAHTAQSYIEQRLNPTLSKALTALAKEKPTSKPEEAVVFLANWLLENNPSKPRIAVPEELLQQQKRQVQEVQAAAAQAAAAAAAQQRPVQRSTSGHPGGMQLQDSAQAASKLNEASMQDAAATKVQACFRGHKARKQVADMRVAAEAAAA